MRNLEELEQLLTIDRNALDNEANEQSQIYYEVTKGFANAQSEADQAKQVMEEIASKLANEYKNSSLEKITEAGTERYYKSHDRYISQYRFYIEKTKIANEWRGLIKAFEQRKSMIQELNSMDSRGYWMSNTGKDTESGDRITQAYIEAKKKKLEPKEEDNSDE